MPGKPSKQTFTVVVDIDHSPSELTNRFIVTKVNGRWTFPKPDHSAAPDEVLLATASALRTLAAGMAAELKQRREERKLLNTLQQEELPF